MQACIFEDGVMTHIFKGLEPGNGTYDLQVGRLAGTLYLLANTDGLVDLEGLKGEGITEDTSGRHPCVPQKGNREIRPENKDSRRGFSEQDSAQERGRHRIPFPGAADPVPRRYTA